MDSTCVEYENGSALHIAATNLSVDAVRVLLGFGADSELKDDLARIPADCVPDAEDYSLIPDSENLVAKISDLLNGDLDGDGGVEAGTDVSIRQNGRGRGGVTAAGNLALNKIVSGKTVLKALGLEVQ